MKKRKYEVVSDTQHLSKETLAKTLANPAISRYAYILHDKDEDEDGRKKNAHYHIMLWLNYSVDSHFVAGWFEIPENFVGKINSDVGALAYLTHRNNPEKHQYEDAEVVANFDVVAEIEKQNKSRARNARLDEILTGIDNGTIRKYNLHEMVSVGEYYSFARAIDKAFEYRTMRLRGAEREMECIFITGPSGSGKTTYAKEIAQNHGFSVFVSSGSNDVLDGYAGQECIILDDLRPSCMGLSDLLKMLDNNTASTVRSRYYNKVLECRLIIITTTKPLETFFNEVFDKENESAIQLMRRCETVVEMTHETITLKAWQKKSRQYKSFRPIENHIARKYNFDDMTQDEMLEKLSSVLALSSEVVDEIRKNGAEYLDGQGSINLQAVSDDDIPF